MNRAVNHKVSMSTGSFKPRVVEVRAPSRPRAGAGDQDPGGKAGRSRAETDAGDRDNGFGAASPSGLEDVQEGFGLGFTGVGVQKREPIVTVTEAEPRKPALDTVAEQSASVGDTVVLGEKTKRTVKAPTVELDSRSLYELAVQTPKNPSGSPTKPSPAKSSVTKSSVDESTPKSIEIAKFEATITDFRRVSIQDASQLLPPKTGHTGKPTVSGQAKDDSSLKGDATSHKIPKNLARADTMPVPLGSKGPAGVAPSKTEPKRSSTTPSLASATITDFARVSVQDASKLIFMPELLPFSQQVERKKSLSKESQNLKERQSGPSSLADKPVPPIPSTNEKVSRENVQTSSQIQSPTQGQVITLTPVKESHEPESPAPVDEVAAKEKAGEKNQGESTIEQKDSAKEQGAESMESQKDSVKEHIVESMEVKQMAMLTPVSEGPEPESPERTKKDTAAGSGKHASQVPTGSNAATKEEEHRWIDPEIQLPQLSPVMESPKPIIPARETAHTKAAETKEVPAHESNKQSMLLAVAEKLSSDLKEQVTLNSLKSPSHSKSASLTTSHSKSPSYSLTPAQSKTPTYSLMPARSKSPPLSNPLLSKSPSLSNLLSHAKSPSMSLSKSPSLSNLNHSKSPSLPLSRSASHSPMPSSSKSHSHSHSPSLSKSPTHSRSTSGHSRSFSQMLRSFSRSDTIKSNKSHKSQSGKRDTMRSLIDSYYGSAEDEDVPEMPETYTLTSPVLPLSPIGNPPTRMAPLPPLPPKEAKPVQPTNETESKPKEVRTQAKTTTSPKEEEWEVVEHERKMDKGKKPLASAEQSPDGEGSEDDDENEAFLDEGDYDEGDYDDLDEEFEQSPRTKIMSLPPSLPLLLPEIDAGGLGLGILKFGSATSPIFLSFDSAPLSPPPPQSPPPPPLSANSRGSMLSRGKSVMAALPSPRDFTPKTSPLPREMSSTRSSSVRDPLRSPMRREMGYLSSAIEDPNPLSPVKREYEVKHVEKAVSLVKAKAASPVVPKISQPVESSPIVQTTISVERAPVGVSNESPVLGQLDSPRIKQDEYSHLGFADSLLAAAFDSPSESPNKPAFEALERKPPASVAESRKNPEVIRRKAVPVETRAITGLPRRLAKPGSDSSIERGSAGPAPRKPAHLPPARPAQARGRRTGDPPRRPRRLPRRRRPRRPHRLPAAQHQEPARPGPQRHGGLALGQVAQGTAARAPRPRQPGAEPQRGQGRTRHADVQAQRAPARVARIGREQRPGRGAQRARQRRCAPRRRRRHARGGRAGQPPLCGVSDGPAPPRADDAEGVRAEAGDEPEHEGRGGGDAGDEEAGAVSEHGQSQAEWGVLQGGEQPGAGGVC